MNCELQVPSAHHTIHNSENGFSLILSIQPCTDDAFFSGLQAALIIFQIWALAVMGCSLWLVVITASCILDTEMLTALI